MKANLLRLMFVSLFIVSALRFVPPVQAQNPEPGVIQGPELVLYADGQISNLYVPAPSFGPRLNSATIDVTFLAAGATDGFGRACTTFPADAQAAYLAAVSIWSGYLTSGVPITISACWVTLGSNILGATGATYTYNFAGAPQVGTAYPSALADALTGRNVLGAGTYDIISEFNGNYGNWYLGTDGQASGKTDFMTVVLHEVTHGLGFSGNVYQSGSNIVCGSIPFIYDRYTQSTDGTAVPTLCSNSTSLKNAMTLGVNPSGIFFNGSNANAANGGTRVPLYTPTSWAGGSSYSHLNINFDGTINALMTFSVGINEVIRDPGPVALGMLMDMGWTITSLPAPPTSPAAAQVSSSQIQVTWNDASSNESGFEVYRSLDGSAWTLATTTAANAESYTDGGLLSGTRYYYRLRAVNAAGASNYSGVVNALTAGPAQAPSDLSAQGTGLTQIALIWTDHSNAESGFQIERQNGVTWEVVGSTTANVTSFTDSGLAQGASYTYRVLATAAVNSDYSASASASTWSVLHQVYAPLIAH